MVFWILGRAIFVNKCLGQIRIYRVPGSVAFLNSGDTVHPILPKSQCWCVDGETKFVLRVRQNTFYRIELPNKCTEDRHVADEFKLSLSKVLQYEATPCPFKRGFHIELPEIPQTPRRPWKPKPRHVPLLSIPGSAEHGKEPLLAIPEPNGLHEHNTEYADSSSETVIEDVRKNKHSRLHDNTHPVTGLPQDSVGELVVKFQGLEVPPNYSVLNEHDLPVKTTTDISEPLPEATTEKTPVERSLDPCIQQAKSSDGEIKELSGDSVLFSRTFIVPTSNDRKLFGQAAPQAPIEDLSTTTFRWLEYANDRETPMGPRLPRSSQSTTESTLLLRSSKTPPDPDTSDPETTSIASSVESLLSFHSFHSLSLSPSYSDTFSRPTSYEEKKPDKQHDRRHRPNLAISAEPLNLQDESSTLAWPKDSPAASTYKGKPSHMTSQLPFNCSTGTHPPPATLRQQSRRCRAQSPLPSPANLYTPKMRLSGHHLTSAILRKTCSLILGPPVQLVALMLNLAVRFANGALSGESFTYNESGQPIPCSWEVHENEKENEGTDEWEDDYGISLVGTSKHKRGVEITGDWGGSWEID